MDKGHTDTSHLKLRGAAMRLTLSAGVANDVGRLKNSLKDLADRLGHSACATGCNSLFIDLERDFSVKFDHNQVALNPQPLPPISARFGLPQDPIPVHVTAPGAVFDSIDNLSGAIVKVLGKLGCESCSSGFDILFQRELDGFAFDAKLGMKGTGRFA
jgi:hypothetical protein